MIAVGFKYSLVSVVGAGVLCAVPLIGVLTVRNASLCTVGSAQSAAADMVARAPAVGVRLDDIPRGSLYARVGMQTGDVVTRVDSATGGVLVVDFVRRGQPGTVSVRLDSLDTFAARPF
jgi:hypothetical protein